MKHFLWIITALLFLNAGTSTSIPQKVKIDEVLSRIKKGADTTYVVNFWATWCAPCVKELPDFEQLDSVYKSQPVKVILVSLDFENQVQTKLVPFIEKRKLQSEVLLLNEVYDNEWIPKVDEKWQGNIPATLIMNSNKEYRTFLPRSTSFHELDSLVAPLLKH